MCVFTNYSTIEKKLCKTTIYLILNIEISVIIVWETIIDYSCKLYIKLMMYIIIAHNLIMPYNDIYE